MEKSQDRRNSADITGENFQRADWDPYQVWQKRIKNPSAPAKAGSDPDVVDHGVDPFAVWKSLFREKN